MSEKMVYIDMTNKNHKNYLENRGDNFYEEFIWRGVNNPYVKYTDKSTILLYENENDTIIGQYGIYPMEWYYKGNKKLGYFGINFYIDPKYRGKGLGTKLARKAIGDNSPWFGIGISTDADKIYIKMNIKDIGQITKYFWFNHLFKFPLILLNFKNTSKDTTNYEENRIMPGSFKFSNFDFHLIEKIENWDDYYEDNFIQFARTKEFLNWRFFNSPLKYFFYYCENYSYPIYFVIRKTYWKGLKVLVITDYKLKIGDIDAWKLIIESSKLLTRKTFSDALVIGSSHNFFNNELKKSKFIKFPRGNKILTNFHNSMNKNVDTYATMADGDDDLNFESWPNFGASLLESIKFFLS